MLVYGAMNWDLESVALAALATLLFLRGSRARTGVALGLGAAAKVYPALLLLPFGLEDLRGRSIAARSSGWGCGSPSAGCSWTCRS